MSVMSEVAGVGGGDHGAAPEGPERPRDGEMKGAARATIPIRGFVGAGALIDLEEEAAALAAHDEIAFPDEAGIEAYLVRGDSQWPRFLDGEAVLFDPKPVLPATLIDHYAIVQTADGRRFLVMHGDEFDVVVRHSKWLALLGDWGYDLALFINTHFNNVRRRLGFGYWSFSAWAKLKVKNAVNFIGSFEQALADEARRRGTDGVICGHIHHPIIRDIEGARPAFRLVRR